MRVRWDDRQETLRMGTFAQNEIYVTFLLSYSDSFYHICTKAGTDQISVAVQGLQKVEMVSVPILSPNVSIPFQCRCPCECWL